MVFISHFAQIPFFFIWVFIVCLAAEKIWENRKELIELFDLGILIVLDLRKNETFIQFYPTFNFVVDCCDLINYIVGKFGAFCFKLVTCVCTFNVFYFLFF